MIWSLPNPWKIIVLAAFAATCIASALLIVRDLRKERKERTQWLDLWK